MFRFHRPSIRLAAALLCAGLLAGTWGCREVSEPCPTATLTITPDPITVAASATELSAAIGAGQISAVGTGQFTATGRDYKGNIVSTSASWSVVAGGGTIEEESGLFTAGSETGTFTNTVRATSGGLTAYATVIVTGSPGLLATITVTPNPATAVVGGTQQFTATGRDAAGNLVTITPTWTVVNSGGTINGSSGLFTAGTVAATFTNTIRATSGAISGTATVIVSASAPGPLATITVTPNPATVVAGGTQQFTATGRDADGDIVAITPTWSVVNSGGTIISGSGLFTAGAATGTFSNTARATSGAISGTATVIVSASPPGPLATITVTPDPATLAGGGAQQFIATGRVAEGDIVTITPTWSVVNSGGTIISGSGLFTAGTAAGTFTNTVRARSGAISGYASVIVSPGLLATIAVAPDPATVVVSGTQQFVATGRDADGNLVAITPAWSVVNSGGTINSGTGLFTAGTVTNTFTNTIRATSGAISGTATVIVSASPPGPLATISVTPNPATMVVSGTQEFTATGRDADGVIITITPTWAVVAGGGTINSGSGLFTAGTTTGTFTNTVRATSGAISGFATVTVTSVVPPATLGSAGAFAVLGGSTVTNTGVTTTIVGDVGVSPGTAIVGIPAGQPTGGSIHAGDPTAAAAQTALTTAYNDLAGRACGTNLTSEDLGGMTLAPGVYCFNSSAGLTGTLTLDGQGDANAVFVIQVGSTLTTASDAAVNLIGSAQAENVYWQIGTSATLGTNTAFKGNIVAMTSITLNTGASLSGRALARNGAVTLDTSALTLP